MHNNSSFAANADADMKGWKKGKKVCPGGEKAVCVRAGYGREK